jgi:3-oxoacyl-[acyl-carrier-protein] synthase-3|tara:strand:+ start:189 stop:1115 length:927 start_codon:yes stop_codon:yes gene_type:complete
MKLNCKISSVGSYFPSKIITNHDLKSDTNDEWIQDKLGIQKRHIVDNELSSDIGYKSALIALKNANLNVDDIDLIVTVTSSPDRISPSTACIIQDKLNPTKNIPSFDLNAVCSGFIYTMELVTPLLNKYETILIVSTETYSRWTDWNDRNSVFFGDGSASVIIQKGKSGWYCGDIFANGKGKENFTIKHGDNMFTMNGKEVYRVGTKVLPQSIEGVLKKTNMDINQIDYFIPHQPSHRILFKTADKIGLPKNKIMMNMSKRANTAGASIPTVLTDLVSQNILQNGDKLLFAAVGSGWTWGAGIMSWEN